jgi:hypothetical protein
MTRRRFEGARLHRLLKNNRFLSTSGFGLEFQRPSVSDLFALRRLLIGAARLIP